MRCVCLSQDRIKQLEYEKRLFAEGDEDDIKHDGGGMSTADSLLTCMPKLARERALAAIVAAGARDDGNIYVSKLAPTGANGTKRYHSLMIKMGDNSLLWKNTKLWEGDSDRTPGCS